MNKRIAAFCFSLLILTSAFYFGSCKRIHESTDLGDDLIPAVDNVNTFDTTILVETYNDTFTIGNADKLINDSTRLGKTAFHYVGHIESDPLFGKSDAELFMELKPPTFKYFFENHSNDSLSIDSVVLVLDYKETFGDTNTLQTVSVYELANTPSNLFKNDSAYLIRVKSFSENGLLGSRTFAPSILNDSIKAYKDTTKNQLRIRLDNSFGTRLLLYDSSATGAYASDSAFRSKFKGFAIKTTSGGNALMGFSLPNSKLALYYRYINKLPNEDTTVRYFTFNSVTTGNANYIKRTYTGEIAGALGGGTTVQDPLLYLQTTPGTFARIKIPDLLTTSNRVVHRAELIVEQVYDQSDEIFFKPELLFIDVLDTALKNYRYMPFDFRLDPPDNSPNFIQFGTVGRKIIDGGGNSVHQWKFNLSRYVQNVLTKREPLHELRLFAPYILIDIYKPNPFVVGEFYPIGVNSAIARGRVRVAGGNNTDPAKKMRLRIVYSKI